MFVLFNLLIGIGLGLIDGVMGLTVGVVSIGMLSAIYALAMIIPSIAVGIRRLHDTDRSGWWCLIGFVPFIGAIVLLIFAVLDSTLGHESLRAEPEGRLTRSPRATTDRSRSVLRYPVTPARARARRAAAA